MLVPIRVILRKGVSVSILVKTGEDFERLFLGVSHLDVEKIPGQSNTISFEEYVDMVRRIQGLFCWNPKRPRTELSRRLFDDVRLILGGEWAKKLRLFVSVGTGLDAHFGTDFFFEVGDSIVTVDLTISRWTRHKSNVILRPDDLFDGDRMEFASKIAGFFLGAA